MAGYLRLRDLQSRGIVHNHDTLRRWIQTLGFPPGLRLGPKTRVWTEEEITAYEDRRRALQQHDDAAA
jgi:predicted DNA-binding transcriptional regulator AlpA